MKKSNGYIYRLRFFLLVLLLTGFSLIPGSAQPVPATADPLRKPLMEVLIELNRAKGVYFLFSQQQIGKTLVNPPVLSTNAGIERLLTQVLRNTGLFYKKVDDRTFVILRKKGEDTATVAGGVDGSAYPEEDEPPDLSQDKPNMIGGRIIDREGKALPGVSVSVRNSHRGTMSDLNGEFSIHAANDDMLTLSCVGFINKETPAGLAARSPIVMVASDQPLTEVLVTALGIGKQEKSLGY